MKSLDDIQPFEYDMPFDDMVAAMAVKSALNIMEKEQARELMISIIKPKFTMITFGTAGSFLPVPNECGMYVNREKLASLIDMISAFSQEMLQDSLDMHPFVSPESELELGVQKIIDALGNVDGTETAKNGSDQFFEFLYDCYMAVF